MLAATPDTVQCKVTGPSGAIRKFALTEQLQKSWLALENEIKSVHGISGMALIQYVDEDDDLIVIDSDAELATLVKSLSKTQAATVKMTVTPSNSHIMPDHYNSTSSMASYRTQVEFSYVSIIPAPNGCVASTDSWKFKSEEYASFNSQSHGSSALSMRPLSQAMEAPVAAQNDSFSEPQRMRHSQAMDGEAQTTKDFAAAAAAREAAYKAAIDANNAAKRAFEEQRASAKAARELAKSTRRGGADALPPYANQD
ncbi:hypothetical protein HDU81_010309 [Chytriomyces hyalinus]|nr:hypothetical protein HDU81_010309 [Chytriomyces hyalinus]